MTRTASNSRVQIRNQPGSLLFNGAASNYVDLPMNFNPSTNDWAITMWVRPTRLSTNDTGTSHVYYSGGDGTGTGRSWVAMNRSPGKNEYESFFGGTDNLSTFLMIKGMWHHLGISYNMAGNVVSYFVNGAACGSNSPTVESATGTHRIGASKIGVANAYAYISKTKVFKRQLTLSEFLSDYVSGTISNSSNLQAQYDFSDGSGTTLTDSSGNGNHGTIVGSDVVWSSVAAIKNRINAISRVLSSNRSRA